jgi:formylmethanofuran dehydrogenase subunit E
MTRIGNAVNARKSLYIREHGKTAYVSAKTRSWEQAERVAARERDKRDPVKIELQKIAEQRKPLLTPIKDALKKAVSLGLASAAEKKPVGKAAAAADAREAKTA